MIEEAVILVVEDKNTVLLHTFGFDVSAFRICSMNRSAFQRTRRAARMLRLCRCWEDHAHLRQCFAGHVLRQLIDGPQRHAVVVQRVSRRDSRKLLNARPPCIEAIPVVVWILIEAPAHALFLQLLSTHVFHVNGEPE